MKNPFRFKSKEKPSEKKEQIDLILPEAANERLKQIKLDVKEATGEDISDKDLIDKIINAWYIPHMMLEDKGISKLIVEDDNKSIRDILFSNCLEVAAESTFVEEKTDLEVLETTLQAIESLIEVGPESLGLFDDFVVGFGVADSSIGLSILDIPDSDIPGVIVSVSKGKVVNVTGSESVSSTIAFLEKAIKRGELNQDRTDSQMDSKYKSNSSTYKKYRDLSKIEDLAHRVISFNSPKSIGGRAVILQLIKENPGTFYDITDFYKIK